MTQAPVNVDFGSLTKGMEVPGLVPAFLAQDPWIDMQVVEGIFAGRLEPQRRFFANMSLNDVLRISSDDQLEALGVATGGIRQKLLNRIAAERQRFVMHGVLYDLAVTEAELLEAHKRADQDILILEEKLAEKHLGPF